MAARTITTTATLMPALAPVLKEDAEEGDVCCVSAAFVDAGADDVGVSADAELPDEDVVVDVADVADVSVEEADDTLVLVLATVDEGMKSTMVIVCPSRDCGAGASNVLFVLVEHS